MTLAELCELAEKAIAENGGMPVNGRVTNVVNLDGGGLKVWIAQGRAAPGAVFLKREGEKLVPDVARSIAWATRTHARKGRRAR